MGAVARELVQARDQRLADLDRAWQQGARRGARRWLGVGGGERGQHARLELGPQPPHRAQALVQGSLAQRLRRVDAEL